MVLAGLVGVPATAAAAGFEYGPQGLHAVGRGGAFTAAADDPSAFYWNPGKLALLRGTRLLYNQSIPSLDVTFDRSTQEKRNTSGQPTGETVEFARAEQQDGYFPMGISLGLTSDFGLQDWTFGIGLVGPSSYGKLRYGSADPAQPVSTRYAFESADVLVAYGALSVAWKYKNWFGIGASLMYGAVPQLKYNMVIVGPGGPTNQNDPSDTRSDLRAAVDVSDWFTMTAVVGGWVRPVQGLEIGLSSRVSPVYINASGNVHLTGASSVFQAVDEDVPANLKFTMPPTFNAGVRYYGEKDGREVWDIEADFVWEGWSTLDAFRLHFNKDTVKTTGMDIRLKDLEMTRKYQDTYSVRLGGQWNVLGGSFRPVAGLGMTLRLGGWWESATMPNAYSMMDFAAFQRFGIGTGLSIAYRGIEVGLSYAHVFQPDRTVAPGAGRVYQQILQVDGTVLQSKGDGGMPYAVNEGTFKSGLNLFTVGLTIYWDELIHGPRTAVGEKAAEPAQL